MRLLLAACIAGMLLSANPLTAQEAPQDVLAADPDITYAYFFLGYCYDQQYESAKRGEPANDALLTKANANYGSWSWASSR